MVTALLYVVSRCKTIRGCRLWIKDARLRFAQDSCARTTGASWAVYPIYRIPALAPGWSGSPLAIDWTLFLNAIYNSPVAEAS